MLQWLYSRIYHTPRQICFAAFTEAGISRFILDSLLMIIRLTPEKATKVVDMCLQLFLQIVSAAKGVIRLEQLYPLKQNTTYNGGLII